MDWLKATFFDEAEISDMLQDDSSKWGPELDRRSGRDNSDKPVAPPDPDTAESPEIFTAQLQAWLDWKRAQRMGSNRDDGEDETISGIAVVYIAVAVVVALLAAVLPQL